MYCIIIIVMLTVIMFYIHRYSDENTFKITTLSLYTRQIDFPSLLKFKFQIATTVPEKSTHKAIYDSRPLLPPLLPFILRTAALATFTLFFMAARIRIMGGQLPTFMR